jgi:hypothetical protein
MTLALQGDVIVDEEQRLSDPQLFARWAREDVDAWRQAINLSVTHLSRGTGQVIDVSQEEGGLSVHVQYARSGRKHPLWEMRTEFTRMTLPEGLTRADLIPTIKARRLLQERAKQADREAFASNGHGRHSGATGARNR